MATLMTTKILNDTAAEVEIDLDDWIFTRDALLFAFSSIVKDEDRIMVIGLWEQGHEDNEYVLQPVGHGSITHKKKPNWIQHKDVYSDMDMVSGACFVTRKDFILFYFLFFYFILFR
jgi:hypothetical protein